MVNFIFMLTHHDVTVPNAIEVFKEIQDTEVTCVGFKDVGLTLHEMNILVDLMRKKGKTIFFEVVSENKEDAIKSAKNAMTLDVDYLIGGKYIEETLRLLKGRVRYMPYVGRVLGHPCQLSGEIDEIVTDARRAEDLGVDGVTLLAYRYSGEAHKLIESVKNAVNIPIIVAGNVDSFERIREVINLGVWGFTIGGAIFEKKFASKGDIREQLTMVIREIRRLKNQIIADACFRK